MTYFSEDNDSLAKATIVTREERPPLNRLMGRGGGSSRGENSVPAAKILAHMEYNSYVQDPENGTGN